MNIRFRLSLQFTVIVATILILFSLSIYYFSVENRREKFFRRLENKAKNNTRLLIEVNDVDSTLLNRIYNNTTSELIEEKIVIYDESNQPIFKFSRKDSTLLSKKEIDSIRQKKIVRYSAYGREFVGVAYSAKGKNYVAVISAFDQLGKAGLNNLRIILFVGLIISLVMTFLASIFYSARALNPINNVIRRVENIEASNLNLRVDEGNGKDEIARLAINFNKMLKRLQDAFDMQKNFVTNASHELRTPLTSITGQIEVTLLSDRTIDEYQQILISILEDIKGLSTLSNGLLDMAQSNIDEKSMKMRTVRIDELLLQAQTELFKRNKNYIVHIGFEDFPDDEGKLLANANENLLKVVFINLMDNACKFSENKKVSVSISFGDSKIVLKFLDTGIGIPVEEQERIFEPFYRAKNSSITSGHGIGLSLSKKIIELHKGSIQIKSQINSGTLIIIKLNNSKNIA